jgi:hypothetical protein
MIERTFDHAGPLFRVKTNADKRPARAAMRRRRQRFHRAAGAEPSAEVSPTCPVVRHTPASRGKRATPD